MMSITIIKIIINLEDNKRIRDMFHNKYKINHIIIKE
jgi:hypothetical protein